MADEAAATTATTATPAAAPAAPVTPERPAWLPAKFETPEAMAKSYTELEKKLGASKPPTSAPQIPTPPAVPDLPDDAGISAIVERTGLKEAEIAQTWQEKGDLSPEQYAAFKKQGIPKGAVKEYLQAQSILGQQIVQKALTEAHAVVGGQKEHENLLQWAGSGGVPAEEVAAMNAELADDPRKIVAITERLYAKHVKALGAGNARPLVEGGSAASASGAGFTSQKELFAAQSDRRYKTDAAYKASVDARIAQTPDDVVFGRK